MYLLEIGHEIRRLRKAAALSQADLGAMAGIARETLNRIESGTYNDLGIKKIVSLLSVLGAEIAVVKTPRATTPDYVARAVATANVSLKGRLHADELIQALVTGQVPPGKAAHLQTLYEDLSDANREGLVQQVGVLVGDLDKVRVGVERLRSRLAVQA